MSGDRATQPPNRGSIVVVAIVAGLCSGIASAVALRMVENEPARSEPVGVRQSSSDAEELAAIRQELAALRQRVAQLRLPDSASNEADSAAPVPTSLAPEAQLATLTVAVNDLAKRLESVVPPHIPPPGPRDETKRRSLEPFFDRKQKPPQDSWLYFTEAELLEALGPPNAITANSNGQQWTYIAEHDASDTRPTMAHFQFSGGRVVLFTRQ